MTALDDQHVAGLIMALEQSIVMGIALAWLFARMLGESEEEEQRAERYAASASSPSRAASPSARTRRAAPLDALAGRRCTDRRRAPNGHVALDASSRSALARSDGGAGREARVEVARGA